MLNSVHYALLTVRLNANQIAVVPDDALDAFSSLELLAISVNRLTEVPDVKALLMLDWLALHTNFITYVHKYDSTAIVLLRKHYTKA